MKRQYPKVVSDSGPDMDVTELCRADIGCVMRADHRLAKVKKVTPVDLANETLITFADDTHSGWGVREALRKKRLSAHVTFTVNQTVSAYALVQAGSGIAIVDPFPMLMNTFPQLVIRPFAPAIETRPRVLLSKTRPASLITGMFIDALKAVSDELSGESQLLLRPSM